MAKAAEAPALDLLDAALNELGPQNLRQKLALIRRTIPNIEKLGENKSQKYNYARAEDICGEIGDAMAHLNISMVPDSIRIDAHEVLSVKRDDNSIRLDVHVLLTVTYLIIDGDSDEKIRAVGAGEGRDSGDKAVPKALTCAKKYALSQALTLRIGEDSEADPAADAQRQAVTPANGGAPAPAQPATPPVRPVPAPPPPAQPSSGAQPYTPPRATGAPISERQGKRMYAIAKGNGEMLHQILAKYGYQHSREVHQSVYDQICKEIEQEAARAPRTQPEPIHDNEDIGF